ncbi:MAG: bifunctional 5,10-methylenetetrahydrofolate dehydrogenase/5,10-methenyltetrahydrofolate cyclohydrolase [Hyphomicrobiaceae bacterium]|nr:bifunctional 5,10-methylenetetrahydrofolate dehydrogenase/5,10-methenyltetrahydrofolate cyclohydrolase [Hyphomicrobiaceae bacterium]
MSAKILDGKLLAQDLKDILKGEVAVLKTQTGFVPRLVNVMIGENHGACAYAKSQKKVAEYVGIDYELETLQEDVSKEDFSECIKRLNGDEAVNGIMIHKPIPRHIEYNDVAQYVDTDKDLEGINVTNIGKMLVGETRIIPCTPASVMEHIKSTGIDLYGKEAVIVGHSVIVGKPLSLLLLHRHATVTICHSRTRDLPSVVRRADIVVAAVGVPKLVKGDWIKPGAAVLDVGVNRIDGKLVGDVDFDELNGIAGLLTPVPGGIGLLTIAMLLQNTLKAFEFQTAAHGS